MSNDSSTGGYLVPKPTPYPAPLSGASLEDFLHDLFSGITGLASDKVRPRWQPVPANRPAISVDWLAFGVVSRVADTFAVQGHEQPRWDETGRNYDTTGNSTAAIFDEDPYDIVMRHEVLDILCSFYGPSCEDLASILREGLSLAQNREALQLNQMGLVSCGDILNVPSLVNDQWYKRADMSVQIRRLIQRAYPILNVASAGIGLVTDQSPMTRDISVTSS